MQKHINRIFQQFLSRENFLVAGKRVAVKGSRGGIDRVDPVQFIEQEGKLDKLIALVAAGEYCPEPVTAVHVPKFGRKGGYRELGLPTVADKIVQTALLQVVEPLAERIFLDTSYGYRPGKGPQKALRRVEHYLRNQRLQWLAGQDIDNFFDTLDHQRLLARFADLVNGEQPLVDLVALWCRMGIVQQDGRWRNVTTGVRQGQVLSPLLANLYLHELDQFVRDHQWGWVRYADDYLLLCRNREEAEAANRAVEEFLHTLHLSLNANPQPVTSLEQGFVFLGVQFQGESRSIAPEKTAKMSKTIDWLLSPRSRLPLPAVLDKLSQSVEGWRRYYEFLAPWEEFARLNSHIDTGLGELLATRRQQGKLTAAEILGLAILHLPTAPTNTKKMRPVALTSLWRKPERRENQADADGVNRKVGKRRKQYLRREVSGSELFVTTPGAFIGKRGQRVIVRNRQIILAEMPVTRLRNIAVAGGGVSLSAEVIRLCAEGGINLTFLDALGKPYATIMAPEGADADLVLRQIENRDGRIGLELARMFVWAKMKNQLSLLKSYRKYQARRTSRFGLDFPGRHEEMKRLIHDAKNLGRGHDPDQFRQRLMGLEGRFASHYWHLISCIIPEQHQFSGRHQRGADDLVNALLNYGYGILYNQTLQAITKTGLNAAVSFLHACQPGRPTLVFDLVEEFRAMVVDRAVFSMLNRRESVTMGEDRLLPAKSRKKLAEAVLDRLGRLVNIQGRQCSLREGIYLQAQAIKRCLLDGYGYRPFLARW